MPIIINTNGTGNVTFVNRNNTNILLHISKRSADIADIVSDNLFIKLDT